MLWHPSFFDGLWQDVRHAVRSLRRSPGLVVVSALSLGLGIGLNAIFYMGIDTIYWHRPTMVDRHRVVGVEPGYANQFSYPDYQDLRRSRIFESALGFRTDGFSLGSGDRVTRASAFVVTPNFFQLLGVHAQIGRTFAASDAAPEREPREVVVTSAFWKGYLGGDPAAVGETLILGGEPFTIVGVLSEKYRQVTGWMGPQLYVPISRLTLPSMEERSAPVLTVLARLASGTTSAQAQAAVAALSESLERTYPDRLRGRSRSASVFPADELQFRGTPVGFRLLAGVAWVTVGLVLLIACVNITGLLVARVAERRREIAVRVAIGAGRARVVQAMLVESFLLVATGAAVGLPLALALNQVPWPGALGAMQGAMALDARVLPYSVALIVAATVVCGVVPALKATRSDVVSEVRLGEGVTPRLWLRQTLVVGQVAISLLLVVASLLCVRSQVEVGRTDLGFDIEHGVVVSFGLDRRQYPGEARVRFAEPFVNRIEQVPGISAVSMANVVPLGGDSLVRSFHPAGRTDIPGARPFTYSVGPHYFRTLAIPVLRGREFASTDEAGTPAVAIVNETFARTYFPNREVLGQRVATADEADAEVIGLVPDHRIGTIGEAPQSVVYYAFAQRPRNLVLHVRTSTSPDALVTAVRRAIEGIDGTVPFTVQTLASATSLEMTMRRAGTWLMGTMGAVGLLLATIGLYGVMSHAVASRTAEIGIRMTLGASASRIRDEVLRRALRVVAAGVGIGALLAVGLLPVFRTFLVGVSAFDPLVFGGAALLLVAVGLGASYVPARRSAQLDPMSALRHL